MTLTLNAEKRELKTKGFLKDLRVSRKIPGIVYGRGIENQNVLLNYHEFERLWHSVGTSSIVDLTVAGSDKSIPVIISEIQRDPVTDRFAHVDLHAVRMDEKLKTEITLNFSGESPAVKELGGNLIISKDHVVVECLPKDLVSAIEVDLSQLTELDQNIHIKDLPAPPGIVILDDVDATVVGVLRPKAEVEAKEEAPVEPDVVGKEGEKEGEETAESGGEAQS